jgi:hypothetical protein
MTASREPISTPFRPVGAPASNSGSVQVPTRGLRTLPLQQQLARLQPVQLKTAGRTPPSSPANGTMCRADQEIEARFEIPPDPATILDVIEHESGLAGLHIADFDGTTGEARVLASNEGEPLVVGFLIIPVPNEGGYILHASVGCSKPELKRKGNAFDTLGLRDKPPASRGETLDVAQAEAMLQPMWEALKSLAEAAEALAGRGASKLVEGSGSPVAGHSMSAAAEAARALGKGVAREASVDAPSLTTPASKGEPAKGTRHGTSGGPGDKHEPAFPGSPKDPTVQAAMGEGLQALENAQVGGAEVIDAAAEAMSKHLEAPGGTTSLGDILKQLADIVSDFLPVVSNLKDAAGAATGKNPVTGEDLGGLGRVIAAIPLLGGVYKLLRRIFKAIAGLFKGGGDDLARSFDHVREAVENSAGISTRGGSPGLELAPGGRQFGGTSGERNRIFGKSTTTQDPGMPAGTGATDAYGNIKVSPHGTPKEQKLALRHEQVHSALSPKLLLLRDFRAKVAMSAYNKSQLMRYLEEALAETIAQLRVNGVNVKSVLEGIQFPIRNGYVTLGGVAREAGYVFLGTLALGGTVYGVSVLIRDDEPDDEAREDEDEHESPVE